MNPDFIPLLLTATIFGIVTMFVVWRIALRIQNLGIIDIAWSYGFLPLAIFYALVTNGDPTRRLLAASMAGLWSLRLGTHVAVRVLGHHPKEDARYGKLRADWGGELARKSFWFFQWQALILAGLSLVFLVPCLNGKPGISPLEYVGLAVWLIAVSGESLADLQLKHFIAHPENEGRICQSGLWKYSRHPNYFFEWLVWIGFFLFAWDSPGGCYTVFCPALMLFFLLRVTGIPLTEQLSLQRKGEAYRNYQRTTSAFVPWFPK